MLNFWVDRLYTGPTPLTAKLVVTSVMQLCSGVDILRGPTALTEKSAPLLLVSTHSLLRKAAVVGVRLAVGVPPSAGVALVPNATQSITFVLVGVAEAAIAAVPVTRATFPEVPDRLIEPVASGVGSAEPMAPFENSCTRKYCPGCRVFAGSGVMLVHEVPADEAYCTLRPLSDTGAEVGLNSSM